MIAALLRNEMAKAVRMKLSYLGILCVLLACGLVFFFTEGVGAANVMNGWEFVSFLMQGAFADIGMIFIAIFCALLIAEENGSGTLRTMLSSPVLRRQFFLAKVITGILYMAMLYTIALVVGFGLGAFRYDFGDVSDSMGLIYESKEVLLNFIVAFFLGWLPMIGIVLYSILISVMTKKGGHAIGTVIGTIILIETVKHFIGLTPYIFTSYTVSSWAIFQEVAMGVPYEWFPETWKLLIVTGIYLVLFFGAGLTIFLRRDLND